MGVVWVIRPRHWAFLGVLLVQLAGITSLVLVLLCLSHHVAFTVCVWLKQKM